MSEEKPKRPVYKRRAKFPSVKLGTERKVTVGGEMHPGAVAHRTSKGRLTAQVLMMEWAIMAAAGETPTTWLKAKGYSDYEAGNILRAVPAGEWWRQREALQDKITATTVKRHIDLVAEMNDQHIAAAKLGMARAIEFMTKMKIEEARDKRGRLYFKGFRSIDLQNCLTALANAQKIQRLALGLNTDTDGSVNIWQQINKTIVGGGDQTEEQIAALAKDLSYEDIKALIATERKKNESAIDVEAKPA